MRRNDNDDPLMPVGMFSRASLVSIKALRSYHELGLLVPAEVDPVTNHRSYRVSQLPDAAVIKRLRDLDLPLKSIAEIVSARDPDTTGRIMAEHETAMRERLDQTARIVDELQRSIERPSLQTPVHVRREAASHALVVRGTVDDADYAPFLDDAFSRLYAAHLQLGAVMAGPTAARYAAEVDTDAESVEASLPIATPVVVPDHLDVVLDTIPAATCAVATHVGGYDTIGDTYRQLGAWVAGNATSSGQPVRELYVVSVDPATGQLLPSDQLRTEICWPLDPPYPDNRLSEEHP